MMEHLAQALLAVLLGGVAVGSVLTHGKSYPTRPFNCIPTLAGVAAEAVLITIACWN